MTTKLWNIRLDDDARKRLDALLRMENVRRAQKGMAKASRAEIVRDLIQKAAEKEGL